ncbi:WxL domain-containing protein [Bacillus tuaregi]|uniref:WxL domain-containing protein n=1 Tax=Bacillus tuaregi TaxID=1816695 RepID=UPI0008F84781|nr:WxL domain-containing protein [Bacillus tuaregi]
MGKKKSVSINQLDNGNKKNKLFSKKVVASVMAFGLVATAFSTTSFADETETPELTSTAVTGGTLSGGKVTFAPLSVTLDGTQKFDEADWGIGSITDATGNGNGWTLSLDLSQFQEYSLENGAYVDKGKKLTAGSLTVLTAPEASFIDNTSSPLETIKTVDEEQELDGGDPVILLSAGEGGGMGSYEFSPLRVKLTVPASAYAKTYKATATVTLSEAP